MIFKSKSIVNFKDWFSLKESNYCMEILYEFIYIILHKEILFSFFSEKLFIMGKGHKSSSSNKTVRLHDFLCSHMEIWKFYMNSLTFLSNKKIKYYTINIYWFIYFLFNNFFEQQTPKVFFKRNIHIKKNWME